MRAFLNTSTFLNLCRKIDVLIHKVCVFLKVCKKVCSIKFWATWGLLLVITSTSGTSSRMSSQILAYSWPWLIAIVCFLTEIVWNLYKCVLKALIFINFFAHASKGQVTISLCLKWFFKCAINCLTFFIPNEQLEHRNIFWHDFQKLLFLLYATHMNYQSSVLWKLPLAICVDALKNEILLWFMHILVLYKCNRRIPNIVTRTALKFTHFFTFK